MQKLEETKRRKEEQEARKAKQDKLRAQKQQKIVEMEKKHEHFGGEHNLLDKAKEQLKEEADSPQSPKHHETNDTTNFSTHQTYDTKITNLDLKVDDFYSHNGC